jgi:RNA polymerase sigma-70 factor (ECF subfamily)
MTVTESEWRAMSDNELASRAAGGSTAAFEILVGRHHPLMFGVCRRITCDEHDAVDALQEALLVAWRRIGTFQGRSAVSTWLFRVATNAALDEVRRRSRRLELADFVAANPAAEYDLETAAAARFTVDWAMAQLPPQFRVAVVLREYYDYTYQQIADLLDIPVDTVKSRISRGRQALADLLVPVSRAEGW